MIFPARNLHLYHLEWIFHSYVKLPEGTHWNFLLTLPLLGNAMIVTSNLGKINAGAFPWHPQMIGMGTAEYPTRNVDIEPGRQLSKRILLDYCPCGIPS